jgi:hypothetical protein
MGIGGIGFCLFWIILDWLPSDQPQKMLTSFTAQDFLTMIPILLRVIPLLGVATACLVGGWAGYVLSRQIIFDQQFPLPD